MQDANVIVIGYISIGEDYEIRTGDGTGPVSYDDQNCRLVYKYNNYASWYLDEVDPNGDSIPDGNPDKNHNFQTYFVNAGDLNWQAFVKTARIQSDGFGGMDYILGDSNNALGCDGFFLDTIETASPWLPYFYTWRGMSDFICRISDLYPEKYILVNRPLFACYLDYYPMICCNNDPNVCSKFCFCDFNSPVKARDKFRQCINAFVWESYSLDKCYNDFMITRDNVIECSDNYDGIGFNMLVLDYYSLIKDPICVPNDPVQIIVCNQIKEVKDLGWLDYVAPGPLDQMDYWVYCYNSESRNNCYHVQNRCFYNPDRSCCTILMDGYFDDWKYICKCKIDTSEDIPRKEADIIKTCITYNSDYLFIKFRLNDEIPENFYVPNKTNFYQIFIDSSENSLGYQGPGCKWNCKFGYLWENGNLFRHIGSTCNDWSWEIITSTPYALGNEDPSGMEVAIPLCKFGMDGENTIKILFRVNAFELSLLDYAPDDPNDNCYQYEHLHECTLLCEGDFDHDCDYRESISDQLQ